MKFISEQYVVSKSMTETGNYNIFCDMDGVLTDLLSQVQILEPDIDTCHVKNSSMHHEKWISVWEKIEKIGSDWWANLPWLQDGRALWLYIKKYNPYILTAAPPKKRGRIHWQAIEGKKKWVARELGDEFLIRTFIVDRDQKKDYAKMFSSLGLKSILIDDDPLNYSEFTDVGGTCILHTSANSSIEELKRLGL